MITSQLHIISCPFSTQEQAFYEGLEKKMGDTVQKLMEGNTGGGNAYISVLLLLLRLRQGMLSSARGRPASHHL